LFLVSWTKPDWCSRIKAGRRFSFGVEDVIKNQLA
jgi:hypothetical protein